jgi:hypothetical protein
LMYEEHDTPEARVSAVCLEASLLALLVRKLFSIRNLFLLCECKVSAVKKSFRDKAPARAAGNGRTRQTGRPGPVATHFKLTALPV